MSARLGARELPLLAVAGVVVIGLLLALWEIGAKPLWFDETFQAQLVTLPFTRFVRRVITFEIFGAPYHFSLWLWKFAGTSEAALRLPSALLAVASLPVLFAIARRVLSHWWAVLAALLLALNGFWVHYAQEARPYALWLLLASLSSLALLRAVERPERRRWLAYVVLTVLAGWTHLMTIFMVGAHAIALLLHPDARRWWREAAVAVAAAALAVVPIAIAISSYNPVRWSWMGPPTLERLWDGIAFLAGELPDPLVVLVLGAWLLGAVVVVARYRRDRRAAWPLILVLGWAVAVAFGPWLVSHVRLMYAPRYLIAALPALVLLATIGVAAIRPRLLAAGLALVLIGVGVVGVVGWYGTIDRADWRSATRLVVEQGTPADGLAFFTPRTFDGGALYQYRYYLTQFEGDRPTIVGLADGDATLEQKVEQAITGRERLWAIGDGFGGEQNARALAVVEQHFDLRQEWAVARLVVRLYARPGTP